MLLLGRFKEIDMVKYIIYYLKKLMSADKYFTDYKINSFPEISEKLTKWRKEGRCIVFTNGCFDLLHAGHVWYLQKAATFGEILILGLNSDSSVRKIKGANRPILAQSDRAYLLSALEAIDCVVIFEEDTPLSLIEEICPNVLVKGGDYLKEDIVGHDFVVNNGGRVEVVRLLEGKSTTGIVNSIMEK